MSKLYKKKVTYCVIEQRVIEKEALVFVLFCVFLLSVKTRGFLWVKMDIDKNCQF